MHKRIGIKPPISLDLVARIGKRLWQEDKGQDLVEYGLLIFLVALSAIASMSTLASAISSIFNSAATSLTSTS
jgi:Flp pilus assembly pilin Flp